MGVERINYLLKQKEGVGLEFKEAIIDLPGNLFETICAMLNRDGGDILLGVSDNGDVKGLDETTIEKLTSNVVTLSNNPNKLNPPFILHPKPYVIKGKTILHLAIPNSSEIHKAAEVIFDRSHDGDFKVTRPAQIATLYNRKRNLYSESRIYPAISMDDFESSLFERARILIRSRFPKHPWIALSDEQLLKKAGLYDKDPVTQKEGYNLAAVLLFGKDETILRVAPAYKVDALVRRVDIARYDDRDYISTNLIDAYDRLMDFVEKHLPDKFHLRDGARFSLRDNIFREVVANVLVHREYLSGYSANFIIYNDRVEVTNPNNPHGNGLLLPDHFVPFPKNPILAKFFVQIGRVDELGSGVLNVYEYIKDYCPGKKPQFIEGQFFKTIIPLDTRSLFKNEALNVPLNVLLNVPLNEALNEELNDTVTQKIKQRLAEEFKNIWDKKGMSLPELMDEFSITKNIAKRDMVVLKNLNWVEFVGPKKTGIYKLTMKGENLISSSMLNN